MELIIALAVIAILIAAIKKQGKQNPRYKDRYQGHNYRKRTHLFSVAERSFLGVLDLAVGHEYRIFGKVRVADVLIPEKGLARKNWQTAFNRIAGKHFDYVLCDPETLQIKAVIELDDASHNDKQRVKRDDFLEKACQAAGLRLIRIQARRNYHVESVREAILPGSRESHDIRTAPLQELPGK